MTALLGVQTWVPSTIYCFILSYKVYSFIFNFKIWTQFLFPHFGNLALRYTSTFKSLETGIKTKYQFFWLPTVAIEGYPSQWGSEFHRRFPSYFAHVFIHLILLYFTWLLPLPSLLLLLYFYLIKICNLRISL